MIADLEARGVPFEYEKECLWYTLHLRYIPDLKITSNNVIVEIKGYFDYEAQRKMAAVKHDNPLSDIKILFSKDNYLRKGGKKKYSDWAKDHGYDFAIGDKVPEEWIK